jgi:lipopolysaccharide biosynthesis glycosyltransferase
MKRALYTCISSEDYLLGVFALNESVKKYMQDELHVLCTSEIYHKYKSLMTDWGMAPEETKYVDLPVEYVQNINNTEYKYWKNTFVKLNLFDLCEFDKILYLDSDMILCGDVSELYERNILSAVDDSDFMNSSNTKGINSGTLLIIPNHKIYERLIKNIIPTIKQKRIAGDQDVLQYTFPEFETNLSMHLDIAYNANAYKLDYYDTRITIKVVHFISGNKPWSWGAFYSLIRRFSYLLRGRRKTYKVTTEYCGLLRELKRKIGFENIQAEKL